MAITAIVAAISTASAVIGAGGVAAFSFTGFGLSLTGFSAVAASFLVTTAMGAALNALMPKPKISAGAQGYSLSGQSGAALDHQIIYGEARVGGARVYDASTPVDTNKYLHRILAFAGHKIDSYQQIWLNDSYVSNLENTGTDSNGYVIYNVKEVTDPDGTTSTRYDGLVRIKQYLGTDDQPADANLITDTTGLTNGEWTADHRLRGIAYLYVRFEYNQDAFPNGVPAVSAKVRGKAVFDPRTSTTVWSDNPALCIRDYLSSQYGLNQPNARIDDTLVSAAATICDQTVESEKRYTCNGAFTTGLEPSAIASNLLSSMGGLLWYGQGKWRMKAAAWTTPTVSFDENDLRSSISLSTRHSRRDNFNAVKGTFAGDETDWQVTDYPEVTDPDFLAADNNVPNVLDFPLPFTSSDKTAQRIARIALNRNREQLTFSASFNMRAFQVQVGDFVNITNARFGWSNKPFEIVEWTFGLQDNLEILVNMTLREISEGVFTGAAGSTFELNNTTLPSPSTGLGISNLTASGGGRTQGDGTFLNSVLLDWDDVDSVFLDHYEVEWKVKTDSSYNATTTDQSDIEIIPVVDNLLYEFRIRAVTVAGIKGPYATVEFTGGGDQTAPGLPTNVSATGGFEYITISWTNPADADLNYVEIWEADSNDSGLATRIGISGGNNFQRTNLGISTTKWYFLKSVDYSGNASAFTSGVSATTTFIDDADFANGVYSLFTEQGLYAIEDVTSLPVAGDFTGQKVFNRTDGKLYQWTGSAWELVVAEPDTFIASDKIIANTITGGLLATSGIITNSAQISDAVVTNAKIENLAVTTIKVADRAITSQTSVTSSGGSPSSTSFQTISTLSFSAASAGEQVLVGTSFQFSVAGDNPFGNWRLVFNGATIAEGQSAGNQNFTSYFYTTPIVSTVSVSGTNTMQLQARKGSSSANVNVSNVSMFALEALK